MVTHIDRLSRGLTHGLQVIEGLHRAGSGVPVLSEDFGHGHGHRQAPGSRWCSPSASGGGTRSGSARSRDRRRRGPRGVFPGRRPSLNERQREVHPGRAVEGSEPAGPGQAPGGQPLDHPAGGQVAVGGAGCVNADGCGPREPRPYDPQRGLRCRLLKSPLLETNRLLLPDPQLSSLRRSDLRHLGLFPMGRRMKDAGTSGRKIAGLLEVTKRRCGTA